MHLQCASRMKYNKLGTGLFTKNEGIQLRLTLGGSRLDVGERPFLYSMNNSGDSGIIIGK